MNHSFRRVERVAEEHADRKAMLVGFRRECLDGQHHERLDWVETSEWDRMCVLDQADYFARLAAEFREKEEKLAPRRAA